MLDLHLCQALLRLLPLRQDDTPVGEMGPKVVIDPLLVAGVAVNIGVALGRDGPKLDGHTVAAFLRVCQSMRVAAHAAKLRPPATQIPAL